MKKQSMKNAVGKKLLVKAGVEATPAEADAVKANAAKSRGGKSKPTKTTKPTKPAKSAKRTTEGTPAVMDRLYSVIMDRRTADPARSHSARLLSRGPTKVAQKFGEEAVECLIEAVTGNSAALVAESADVLYHLIVMWVATGVNPDQVWAELHRREGISGVDEKAARTQPLIGTKKIP
jgi:phosphoribosyl-ATP pyrophosphohydrolase